MKNHVVPVAASLAVTMVVTSVAADFTKVADCASPGGGVRMEVGTDANGHLAWRMESGGRPVVQGSQAGVIVNRVDTGADAKIGRPVERLVDEKFPWRGPCTELRNHCRVAEFPVESGDWTWTLEVRVFDGGAAYRCRIPGAGRRQVGGEAATWNLPAGAVCYANPNTVQYEGLHVRAPVEGLKAAVAAEKAREKMTKPGIGMPLTVERPGGGYAVITEAQVMGWSSMTLEATDGTELRGAFVDDPQGWEVEGEMVTPWRVVLVSADLDGLVQSPVIPALCPPPDPALFPQGLRTPWIRPGRCLWQWWAFNDAGTHWSRQFGFVDRAAELKCEYYLVDEGWQHTRQEWFKPGDPEGAWPRMKELCAYAKGKGVGIWVWQGWTYHERAQWPGLETRGKREVFFRRCREAGVAGVKIDFMDNGSHDRLEFYQDCLRLAAAHGIMVNFHGANKPAGEARTWPNEMTREGIRGLEHNKWGALPPAHYATLPFTRMIAGHGDFTPTTFNPEFLKGTTFAQQLACAVVLSTPMLCWADNPELYLKSPVVEALRAMPVTWDETRVLAPSRIGELAAFARRAGGEWWVGVVNGESRRTVDLPLDFLGDGAWAADVYADGTRPMEFTLAHGVGVSAKTPYRAELAAGGGVTLRLRRKP